MQTLIPQITLIQENPDRVTNHLCNLCLNK